ncbi:hypothetical protein BH23CHL7_BH23CHL7_02210 [soil metagenome]
MSAAQVELELKYDATDLPAVAAWLDERFPPDMGGWTDARLTDRYFDTPDYALARAGYGARLRRQDGRLTVGLKRDVKVDGPRHRRRELDGPASAALDPARWPASEPRDIVEQLCGGRPLVERFSLRQSRRERRIDVNGAELLLSLDDVRVAVGGRQVGRLRGLEVELVGGRKRALARLARQLEASGLVEAQPLSKMQLGHGLAAAELPLDSTEPFAEAGRKVLARHLLRMLDREQLVRRDDTLAIKQMRVATRRMRSVWRLFDGAYRRSEQKRYLAELRAVADRLGAVRDLDVLLEGLPADPALAPLGETWRAERAAAMAQLLAHLDSAAYRRFVADHRGFVGSVGHATARRLASAHLDEVAGDRLLAAYAALRESDPDRFDDDTALHVLRINGKRLRYALETLRELTPAAPWERLHARLIALQDLLGEIHDGVVAAELAKRWLAEKGAGANELARAAVADYSARLRDEPLRGKGAVGRAWRAVSGRGFERDLRRVVAALGGPAGRGELTDS